MAGDWIPITHELPTRREVVILSSRCRRDVDTVLGWLVRFWLWADAETADGFLDGITAEMASEILRIPIGFFRVLADVGWLEIAETGLRIPNWDRWFSASAKARLGRAMLRCLERKRDAAGSVDTGSRTHAMGCAVGHNVDHKVDHNVDHKVDHNVDHNVDHKVDHNVDHNVDHKGTPFPPITPYPNKRTEKKRRERGGNINSRGSASAEPLPPSPSGDELRAITGEIERIWEIAVRHGLPPITRWTDQRLHNLESRLADPSWLDDFRRAVEKIPECPFLTGSNDRGWRASIDWFLRPDSVTRILEGQYDDSEDEFWRDLDAK